MKANVAASLSMREQNQVLQRLRQDPAAVIDAGTGAHDFDNAPNALIDHPAALVRHQAPATACRPTRPRPSSTSGAVSGAAATAGGGGGGSALAVSSSSSAFERREYRDLSPPPFVPDPPATAPSMSSTVNNGNGSSSTNAKQRIRSRDLVSTKALQAGEPLMSSYVALPVSNHESMVKLFMDADVPEEAERLQKIVVPGELFAAAEKRAATADTRFSETFAALQGREHELLLARQRIHDLERELSRAHADVLRYQTENSDMLEVARAHAGAMQELQRVLAETKAAKADVERERDAAEAYVAELQSKTAKEMARSARLHADYEMAVRSGGAQSQFLQRSSRSVNPGGVSGAAASVWFGASAIAPGSDSGGDLDGSSRSNIPAVAADHSGRRRSENDESAEGILPDAATSSMMGAAPLIDVCEASAVDADAVASSSSSQTARNAPSRSPHLVTFTPSLHHLSSGGPHSAAAAAGNSGSLLLFSSINNGNGNNNNNNMNNSVTGFGASSGAGVFADPDSVASKLARKTRELAKLRLRLFVREVTASRQILAMKQLADDAQAELASFKRRYARKMSLHASADGGGVSQRPDPVVVDVGTEDGGGGGEDTLAAKQQRERAECDAAVLAVPAGWGSPLKLQQQQSVRGGAGGSYRTNFAQCRSQRCRELKHSLRDRLALLEQDAMARYDVDANDRRAASRRHAPLAQQLHRPTAALASSSRASSATLSPSASVSGPQSAASASGFGMDRQETSKPSSAALAATADGGGGPDAALSRGPPSSRDDTATNAAAQQPTEEEGGGSEVNDAGSGVEVLKQAANPRSVLAQLLAHIEECTRFVLSLGADTMPEAHHAGRALHSNKMLFAASTALVDGAASFLAGAETAVAALASLENLLFSSRSLPEARVRWAAARERAQYGDVLGMHVDTGAVAMRDTVIELRCFQRREMSLLSSSGAGGGGAASLLLGSPYGALSSSSGALPGALQGQSPVGAGVKKPPPRFFLDGDVENNGDDDEEDSDEDDSDGLTGSAHGDADGAESVDSDDAALDFRTFKLAHNIYNVLREFELEIARQKSGGVPARGEFRAFAGPGSDTIGGSNGGSGEDSTSAAMRRQALAAALYTNTPEGIYRLMHDAAAKLRLVVPVVVTTMRGYKAWDTVLMESRDADKTLLERSKLVPGAAKGEAGGDDGDGLVLPGDDGADTNNSPTADGAGAVSLVKSKLIKKEKEQQQAKIAAAEEYRAQLLTRVHPRWKMLLSRLMTFSRKQLRGFQSAAQAGGTWRTDKRRAREAEAERQKRELLAGRHAQNGGTFSPPTSPAGLKATATATAAAVMLARGGGGGVGGRDSRNVFDRLHHNNGGGTSPSRGPVPDVVRRLYPAGHGVRAQYGAEPHQLQDGVLVRESSLLRRQRRRDHLEVLDKGPQAAMQRWLARRQQVIAGYQYYSHAPAATAQPQPQSQEQKPQEQPQHSPTLAPRYDRFPAARTDLAAPAAASEQQQQQQQQQLGSFTIPKGVDAETRALLENKHVISQVSTILRTALRDEQDRTERLRGEVLALRRQLDAALLVQSNAAREEHMVGRLRQQLFEEQDAAANAKRELQQTRSDLAHARYELDKLRKQVAMLVSGQQQQHQLQQREGGGAVLGRGVSLVDVYAHGDAPPSATPAPGDGRTPPRLSFRSVSPSSLQQPQQQQLQQGTLSSANVLLSAIPFVAATAADEDGVALPLPLPLRAGNSESNVLGRTESSAAIRNPTATGIAGVGIATRRASSVGQLRQGGGSGTALSAPGAQQPAILPASVDVSRVVIGNAVTFGGEQQQRRPDGVNQGVAASGAAVVPEVPDAAVPPAAAPLTPRLPVPQQQQQQHQYAGITGFSLAPQQLQQQQAATGAALAPRPPASAGATAQPRRGAGGHVAPARFVRDPRWQSSTFNNWMAARMGRYRY